MLAYYAQYIDGHHGALDRIGGLPSHLPVGLHNCECDSEMSFVAQLYFQDKDLPFLDSCLLGVQLFSCDRCLHDIVLPIPEHAGSNESRTGKAWHKLNQWRDIKWVVRDDPEPTDDTEQFWVGDVLAPEYAHLLDDKIGGCFPVVDHDGTSALKQGIIGQLSLDTTIYLTLRNEGWSYFRY